MKVLLKLVAIAMNSKIRHVTLVFSAFNSGPSGHIISCHVPDVKMLRFFGILYHDTIGI